ncbi:XRE family transcriptional regulator [Bosea sp. AAP35]|uniref:HigA family addiction module antitoxin n=1 Tax=Bosea sp. AAP35 TaxID=1523417 RepID=UPI0006BA0945|nr:HigA family addiction module antitoxin [Bosea sp. AAP35]KPF65873.1 XRE family transcriptional regulator [Bosea sp. AAP35]
MENKADRLPPLHPGEVLREEFMTPLGLSAYAVAKACGTPRTRIERIAREQTGITADSALRLGKLFGTSAEFWLGLQDDYDLEAARLSLSDDIARIKPIAA